MRSVDRSCGWGQLNQEFTGVRQRDCVWLTGDGLHKKFDNWRLNRWGQSFELLQTCRARICQTGSSYQELIKISRGLVIMLGAWRTLRGVIGFGRRSDWNQATDLVPSSYLWQKCEKRCRPRQPYRLDAPLGVYMQIVSSSAGLLIQTDGPTLFKWR